ncbi:hypothetical protein EV138_1852 [Kribbella voronezhensis]|jgi:hypothetical protein|uniref:Uncharacterized protein n=1 Tax=Kribbella voronezhensis TaxID=2512212 RepID=A0A4R7TAK6_9ACTN|nr:MULTISPECIES: hypothetical protein [Kribbella]TDU88308.1 hypothetical protein EV138_1852 [Kribbella voronezhensis]
MADQNLTENEQDPGASTQMFRAFVNEGTTEATEEPKLNGRTLAIVGGVVVLIAVIAAILVL